MRRRRGGAVAEAGRRTGRMTGPPGAALLALALAAAPAAALQEPASGDGELAGVAGASAEGAAARPAAAPPADRSPAQIAAEALPSVVEVVTYAASGRKRAGGSGFVATPDGHVITSHHVLEGAVRAEVHFGDGEVYEVEHVAATDIRRDLVVLRIAGFDLPALRLGDSRDLSAGDPVVVIGSPLGLTNTVTHGLVSARRQMDGKRVLQISAPVSSGSSGGPVFDHAGRVVGVLAGFMRKGQNVNFAVPVEYARGLLGLPSHAFSVESVGRKRVAALVGGATSEVHGLSLQGLLRGESVPGEDRTPWALEPRRVDPERVKANPATAADSLTGTWELRELSRVPDTRSGLYRGALVSDGTGLSGPFFGALVEGGDPSRRFDADRVRDFRVRLEPEGRATLLGSNGCSYYVRASRDAMTGVYECTDGEGDVYDVGAVELRRVHGAGPSGVYDVEEAASLGLLPRRTPGRLVLFGLPDGRWLGAFRADGASTRLLSLEKGRWTADGHLRGRLPGADDARLRGMFADDRVELHYLLDADGHAVEATLEGRRVGTPPPEGP